MSQIMTLKPYDEDAMGRNLNVCKDAVIDLLVKDGLITPEQAKPYLRDYHVYIKTPSAISRRFGQLFQMFKGKSVPEEKPMLVILKQVSFDIDDLKSDS